MGSWKCANVLTSLHYITPSSMGINPLSVVNLIKNNLIWHYEKVNELKQWVWYILECLPKMYLNDHYNINFCIYLFVYLPKKHIFSVCSYSLQCSWMCYRVGYHALKMYVENKVSKKAIHLQWISNKVSAPWAHFLIVLHGQYFPIVRNCVSILEPQSKSKSNYHAAGFLHDNNRYLRSTGMLLGV